MLRRESASDLMRDATTVVDGTVTSVVSEPYAGGPRTAVRLRVGQALKGARVGSQHAADTVTVYILGGVLSDGSRLVVDGMPSFVPGERCRVYADARGWVIGGYQGKVPLDAMGTTRPEVAGGGAAASQRAPLGTQSAPVIASVSPYSASAGTGTSIDIAGSGFGDARGIVEFTCGVFGVNRMVATDVALWTDTHIRCAVPTGTVGAFALSAGSGPVVVTTADGAVASSLTDLRVPFGYSGLRFAGDNVTYRVNADGTDVAACTALIDAAADAWNQAGSAFRFSDGGPTGATFALDGQNVISWSDEVPDGVIAWTGCYTTPAGVITECDLQFNGTIKWGDGAVGSGTTDVQSIVEHEFGHWLCLLDIYGDGDVDRMMYGFDTPGQRRVLDTGDIAGIRWIYPGPSGSIEGTACDDSGPLPGVLVLADTMEPTDTADQGAFSMLGVPPGQYHVAFARAGYTTQRLSDIAVAADQTASVSATLTPGESRPVYRFYNRRNGSHFYTASAAERDSVRSHLAATYTYEGVAFDVCSKPALAASPVYRFYNRRNGSHFYTASALERNQIMEELAATYAFEGTAFYVSP